MSCACPSAKVVVPPTTTTEHHERHDDHHRARDLRSRSPATPTRPSEPDRHHRRPRRRAVVHQRGQRLDRADHDRRRRHATSPIPSIAGPDGITLGPDGALWFTNAANNTIGRITTVGHGHALRRSDHQPARSTSRPAPTARCGSRTTARHGQRRDSNSIGRITTVGVVTKFTDDRHPDLPCRTPTASPAGPDGALWFANTGYPGISQHHHGRRDHAVHRTRPVSTPYRVDRRSRRRDVVHEQRQRLGRAGSPPTGRSPTTPTRPSPTRRASSPAPTARCGSPTTATTRSGGSRPAAPSPTSTTRRSRIPDSITAGPDGALWFTNVGNNTIGRIAAP